MNKKIRSFHISKILIAILVSGFIMLLTTSTSLATYPSLPPYPPIYDNQSYIRRLDMIEIAESYMSYRWKAKNSAGSWDLSELIRIINSTDPKDKEIERITVEGTQFDDLPPSSFNDWHGGPSVGKVVTPDYDWCSTGVVYKTWGCWKYADNINVGLPYYWGGRNVIQKNDLNQNMPDLSMNSIDAAGNIKYFDEKVQAGWKVGNINTGGPNQINGSPVGVDCTGFVMQVWRLGTDFNPSILAQFSRPIDFAALQAGDIIYNRGSSNQAGHAILFKEWGNYEPGLEPSVGEEFKNGEHLPSGTDIATRFWAYEAAAPAKKVVLSEFRLTFLQPGTDTYGENPEITARTDIVHIQRIQSCSRNSENGELDCLKANYPGPYTGLEYTMIDAYPRTYFNPIDVEFVIDTSGSMDGAALKQAKDYAKAIIDILGAGDKVGVIEFSSTAGSLIDLSYIYGAETQVDLKTRLDHNLIPPDFTSIYTGMEAGMLELEKGIYTIGDDVRNWRPDPNRIMVLISDGQETVPPYIDVTDNNGPNDFLEYLYETDKISVYTLQTDGDAPSSLLQTIAKRTKGVYAQSLAPILEGILARKHIIQPAKIVRGNIPLDKQYVDETLDVDSSMGYMTVSLFWSGTPLNISLKQQDGTIINPADTTNSNVIFTSGDTYRSYKINAPQSGQWSLHISGAPGQAYDLSISTMDAMDFSAQIDKEVYLSNEPIKFTVSIDDNVDPLPLTALTTPVAPQYIHGLTTKQVSVENPAHQKSTILLHDDGTNGDDVADDGIYTTIFDNTSLGGTYNFIVQIAGKNNRAGETFTREKRLSAQVRSIPRVVSITRTSTKNPVSSYISTVGFNVTFSEPVIGVDTSDFKLTTSNGLTDALINTMIGAGKNYTVYVNTNNGSGTLRLDLVDDDTIKKAFDPPIYGVNHTDTLSLGSTGSSNGSFTSGESYNIDANLSTIVVNKLADTNDGACDSDCSLREAIAAASGDDVITFASGLSSKVIHLGSVLTLSKNIAIYGDVLGIPMIISGDTDDNGIGDVPIFSVKAGVVATFNHLTITKGKGTSGGGLYTNGTMTIVMNSTFIDNTASAGAGINSSGLGILQVVNSTFSRNVAVGYVGGAISIASNVDSIADTTLVVMRSTFFANSAGNMGGAIYNSGKGAMISNSTFFGNTAYKGGAIYNGAYANTLLTLLNSTISGNTATAVYGGGGIFFGTSPLRYANTIIANSIGGDCYWNNGAIIEMNINNLVEDGLCDAGLRGDPNLGPLADNGGSTQTMALLSGSIGLNAGDNAICTTGPNHVDQRGVSRPQADQCDLGAYEKYAGATPVVEAFTVAAYTDSFDIPITRFIASDDLGIIGYMITQSAAAPLANDTGWSATIPVSYTVNSYGSYTLYAWAKDESDNVSPLFKTPRSVIVTSKIAFTIAGTTGVADVLLSYNENGPKTVASAQDGSYSIIVPYNWSGTVNLSKTGYLTNSRIYNQWC